MDIKRQKRPSVGSLVTTSALNTKIREVETKVTCDIGLVKERDYNAKRSEIKAKYFTTSDKIY